jgi:putative oxidoreductase
MSRDLAILLLRLSGLGLAHGHGWGKVSGLAAGHGERLVDSVSAIGFPAPLVFAWAAALAEFVGGLCVALGLGTRIAAAFTGFTMLVAAFGRHQAHRHFLSWLGLAPVPEETLKAWGNPELALVYLLAFVTIALLGPGRFSLDARIGFK